MPRRRTVYIGDARWKIERASLRGKYGECDYGSRTIRIHHTLAGDELLDTLLHELIHARWPDLQESSVEEFAGTLAHVLSLEGFRRREDDE